ncbi:fluoride efflux transporter FluC [Amycolatopsis thermoflava]|uniref:fluoride efflux transporter FluC n=1 Tax=Amycolatopsis thermoflava TaxID=84480 RepID=UPI00364A48C7
MSEPMTNPVDPDVDLHVPAERQEVRPSPWPVLVVISAGGVLGALARYGLQHAFPHHADQFAWATFAINAAGCLLIGVLMALITELWSGRRLLRPFLGVGVLGGFTTFSTYVVDIQQALTAGAARAALVYLAATVMVALLAVWTGATLTSQALRRRPRPREAGAQR